MSPLRGNNLVIHPAEVVSYWLMGVLSNSGVSFPKQELSHSRSLELFLL